MRTTQASGDRTLLRLFFGLTLDLERNPRSGTNQSHHQGFPFTEIWEDAKGESKRKLPTSPSPTRPQLISNGTSSVQTI
jgi:hypothetical protein